jgi:hypothetical protein
LLRHGTKERHIVGANASMRENSSAAQRNYARRWERGLHRQAVAPWPAPLMWGNFGRRLTTPETHFAEANGRPHCLPLPLCAYKRVRTRPLHTMQLTQQRFARSRGRAPSFRDRCGCGIAERVASPPLAKNPSWPPRTPLSGVGCHCTSGQVVCGHPPIPLRLKTMSRVITVARPVPLVGTQWLWVRETHSPQSFT